MAKDKRKRILALILSGVLLVGNANPITANAAESPDEIEVHTQLSNEEEGADSETDALENSAEENAAEESSIKGSTVDESASEESANKESIIEENTDKGNTEEENTIEGSSANEGESEEGMTEGGTETEAETETESETETDETEEETQEEVKALESDRQISENLLSDFNASFEWAGDDGAIYWWNGPSWSQDGISRKEYENNGAPTSDCGGYYLEVIPSGGESVAQVCTDGIAAVIKPEITYEFTYFAKLSEGQGSGAVQIQVSSVKDDNWSSSASANIEFDSDITLDAAQWKQVSGTFKIPAHDAHNKVSIKFTGSDGLSFCIDDLRVAAVDGDNAGDDEQIAENILSNYNTSFESVDEKGNLYWWNDWSWGQSGISQKAYGKDEALTSGCGEYYMEVIPCDGASVAQVNDGGIAALIKPEVLYEFTYLAKLSQGQDSGEVSFKVSSGDTKNAEIKLDKEIKLDSAQWSRISGTFKLPANNNHKAVKIQFAGSDGLSFCIDDLRVAALEDEKVDYGDNLVKNPNFAESDLSVWEYAKGNAAITTAKADEAIFDDVTTYGIIADRTSSQDCFAQDMTDVLRSGKSYKYSFWVMLDAEDYKDAPANQREVCFAPYVKVDGSPTYWGSYSTGVLDSGCIKQIPAGKWVKFEGNFNPQFDGEADELVVRILEQGTDYGSGDCVKGKYYVTGVSICEVVKPVKEIEWDIPNLKDTISGENGIGADSYTGTSIMLSEISDESLMNLVEKHFNAITFGNEMKMDAMFGYHNNEVEDFETVTWTRADGTVMNDYKVPALDYSRADKMLDVIKAWNDEHPDDFIKIRGHVLVWHSQAPEWFFHENWDKTQPDASPEVMDVRQEWYIKTVLEHFTGKDSPYKDMFYGWDVVNEAVSDSTGTYRKADEKSSWWRVYNSEEFIVNAFRYANHYAPSDVELYYNDYNECMGNKVDGIEKLLKEVKSHENDAALPTRISGMGMQSHHTISSPTVSQIRDAAVRYGKAVGKVQLTELDIKASDDFDGTDATLQNEYTKQAYRYKEIYDVMREVDAMDGIDVNGITVWGVIDGNSWLQTSNDVGGASDGSKPQAPLLFDDDYKAKPAFYAFVDAEKLEPYIRNITVIQADAANLYANGKTYAIQGIDAGFTPVWTDTELKVQVKVSDNTVDASDKVRLYIDWDKSMAEGTFTPVELNRTECQSTEDGYVAEFAVSRELAPAMGFGMDIVVFDGEQSYAFNDLTMIQDTSSKYYASAITKPYTTISKVGNGVITIDGDIDSAWEQAEEVQLRIRTGSAKASAVAKLLWDEQYLYVLADVTDSVLDGSSSQAHEQDSFEVFIDENNHKSDAYEQDDKQYRVNYVNDQSFNGEKCIAENIISAAAETDKGYLIEAAYKWTDITPVLGDAIGIDLQINDAEGGTRIGTVSWYDESGQGWSSPGVFGTATLGELISTSVTKDDLSSLIAEYETLRQEDYTAESWAPYAKALEEAKAALDTDDISQEKIKEAYDVLKTSKESLIPNVITKEGLSSLVTECESLKQDDYTSESWEAFADALGKAKDVLGKPDPEQNELNTAYKELVEARAALKTQMPVKDELSSLMAECDTFIQEEYTDESWIPFAKALSEAKAALSNQDASQEEIQKAYDTLKEAKAGLRKRGEPDPVNKDQLRDLISKCESLNPNDYMPDSWEIYKKALADAKAAAEDDAATQETVQNAFDQLAKALEQLREREGLWAFDIADITYTGKALKPAVTVYNGRTLLTQGKDYTVSYKKNKNVTGSGNEAQAIIKGKGNYTGSITKTFHIVPKSLGDEDIVIADLYVKAPKAGKSITLAPVVTRGGKKLNKKEYVVGTIKDKDGNVKEQVTDPGTYTVEVRGVENNGYTGTREIRLTVLNSAQVLMSAVKVTGIKNKEYTGGAIEPEFTVKYGKADLTKDVDYSVTCDSREIGAATAVIKGIGDTYVGEKTVTFQITGTVLKAKDVTLQNAADVVYTGSEIRPDVVVANNAVRDTDYIVTYDKNDRAGTAAVIVKGIGKYTGTVKKTFKIAAFDIGKNDGNKLTYHKDNLTAPYMKGGSKLKAEDLNIVFGSVNLVEGVDYTLVYSANKKADAVAAVKIKGKGNFKGTTDVIHFTVEKQDIANLTNISAADVLKKKAGNYKSVSPVIKDLDGKALKKGTDFTDLEYVKVEKGEKDGVITEIITDIVETPVVGDTIRVTVTGSGNYKGTAHADFRIIEDNKSISKAKVTVKQVQNYTGKEITLSGEDLTVTLKAGNTTAILREGTDYEIVTNGYSNNINKGTGKVTIRGIGEYGGMKTVSFKIKAHDMKDVAWYGNLYNRAMSWFNDIFNK